MTGQKGSGAGPRRGETLVMDGPAGVVYARTRGGKVRLRAYRHDGDKLKEAELGLAAVRLFDAVWREVHPGTQIVLERINIIDDHEPG